MRPRLLVTGGTGFLGSRIATRAEPAWQVAITFCSREPAPSAAAAFRMDLRRPAEVERVLAAARPRVVIHTAYASAETLLEPVVVEGSGRVAAAAAAVGAALVHVSTDMVFDGASPPYDEDAAPCPVNAYGRAKARAEARVRAAHPGAVVARCSLLYSVDPPDPRMTAALADAAAGRPHTLFTDEIRSPAEVSDVAVSLLAVAARLAAATPQQPRAGLPPILHVAGPEALSRWSLGAALLSAMGAPPGTVRAGTAEASGLVRPRELVLVARRTPGEITAPLRSLAQALGSRRA